MAVSHYQWKLNLEFLKHLLEKGRKQIEDPVSHLKAVIIGSKIQLGKGMALFLSCVTPSY